MSLFPNLSTHRGFVLTLTQWWNEFSRLNTCYEECVGTEWAHVGPWILCRQANLFLRCICASENVFAKFFGDDLSNRFVVTKNVVLRINYAFPSVLSLQYYKGWQLWQCNQLIRFTHGHEISWPSGNLGRPQRKTISMPSDKTASSGRGVKLAWIWTHFLDEQVGLRAGRRAAGLTKGQEGGLKRQHARCSARLKISLQ